MGFSYRTAEMAETFAIVSLVLAAVVLVLALIFIVPAKKRDTLPMGLKILHDVCNFNGLMVEVILKAVYIFATAFSILFGFFALFLEPLIGLIMLFIYPIALRIVFEFMMMAILLVKNVIAINMKLKSQTDSDGKDGMGFDYSQFKSEKKPAPVATAAPVAPAAPAAEAAASFCPNCGAKVSTDSAFCSECGTKVR